MNFHSSRYWLPHTTPYFLLVVFVVTGAGTGKTSDNLDFTWDGKGDRTGVERRAGDEDGEQGNCGEISGERGGEYKGGFEGESEGGIEVEGGSLAGKSVKSCTWRPSG